MKTAGIKGPHGEAWMIDLDAIGRKIGVKEHASVVGWIISAPWAHPLWHSYSLNLIHLRPLPGYPPPTIYLPGATHEIILHALDPDHKINLEETPRWLSPANFAAQFIEPSDEAAKDRIRQCVFEITRGILSPDTDFTQQWIARFNASMIKGDPSRAGETIIEMVKDGATETLVMDPKPPDAIPDPENPPWKKK